MEKKAYKEKYEFKCTKCGVTEQTDKDETKFADWEPKYPEGWIGITREFTEYIVSPLSEKLSKESRLMVLCPICFDEYDGRLANFISKE